MKWYKVRVPPGKYDNFTYELPEGHMMGFAVRVNGKLGIFSHHTVLVGIPSSKEKTLATALQKLRKEKTISNFIKF